MVALSCPSRPRAAAAAFAQPVAAASSTQCFVEVPEAATAEHASPALSLALSAAVGGQAAAT